jgi:hypothetical protein
MLQGISLGMNNGDLPDGVPAAFARGYEFGKSSRDEAESFRIAQSIKGVNSAKNRLEKTGSAQPKKRTELEPVFEPVFEDVLEPLVEPNHNPQTTILKANNEEQITKEAKPPARSARFIPPTEREWMEYCQKTWSDWHPSSIQSSWNHYESVGWMAGKSKIKDWRATARNAHNTAKQYGKLQPKGVTQPSYFPSKVSVHSDKPINSPFDSILKENGFL